LHHGTIFKIKYYEGEEMKGVKRELDFSNLFSPAWQEFQERKNRISERTKCFKVCSKCGEIKSIFKFSIDKRSLDGRIGICKICRSQESLKYYYENRDRILTQSKEYQKTNKRDRSGYFENYQREHKEHLKKIAQKWYKKNKKAIKKRSLKYYEENKEACQVIRELWREKNKENIKKYNREYKLKAKISELSR
jgi:hypothetical protein